MNNQRARRSTCLCQHRPVAGLSHLLGPTLLLHERSEVLEYKPCAYVKGYNGRECIEGSRRRERAENCCKTCKGDINRLKFLKQFDRGK